MIAFLAALSLNLAPVELNKSIAIGPGGCLGALSYTKGPAITRFQKLGQLPDANMEVAVNRVSRATGCPAPVIVRYDVSR